MTNLDTITRFASLGEAATRTRAAADLAAHVGAEALLLFVEDTDSDTLASAPGSSQVRTEGPEWQDFLCGCRASAVHSGTVPYPRAATPAVGCRGAGVLLVFVGSGFDRRHFDSMIPLLPLLGPALRAERALAAVLPGNPAWPNEEFLERLGHEFRNHLTPVTMVTYVLQRKGENLRELGMLERQISQMLQLVNNVLDVSRIARGKAELRKERLELATVTARAVAAASPLLAEKEQALSVDIPLDGLPLDADADRLEQVFSNLLVNAAKHSESNTHIAITATRQDQRVAVRVKDQGFGIEPERLDTIFEYLVRRRRRGDHSAGGLGLGLALVSGVVGLHGGTVRVVSEGRGKGSEFIVELPLATADGGRASSH